MTLSQALLDTWKNPFTVVLEARKKLSVGKQGHGFSLIKLMPLLNGRKNNLPFLLSRHVAKKKNATAALKGAAGETANVAECAGHFLCDLGTTVVDNILPSSSMTELLLEN